MSFALLSRKTETDAVPKARAASSIVHVGKSSDVVGETLAEGGVGQPRWSLSRMTIEDSQQPEAKQIQAKLAVNEPGDEYEQEADRVAARIMRTQEPLVDPISLAHHSLDAKGKCNPDGACSIDRSIVYDVWATAGRKHVGVHGITLWL